MLGFILYMLVVGIIAGFLARLLVPGRDSMGFFATVLLGIVGSLIGGFLGYVLFGKDLDEGALQVSGIIGSIIGAVIALLIYRAVSGSHRRGVAASTSPNGTKRNRRRGDDRAHVRNVARSLCVPALGRGHEAHPSRRRELARSRRSLPSQRRDRAVRHEGHHECRVVGTPAHTASRGPVSTARHRACRVSALRGTGRGPHEDLLARGAFDGAGHERARPRLGRCGPRSELALIASTASARGIARGQYRFLRRSSRGRPSGSRIHACRKCRSGRDQRGT